MSEENLTKGKVVQGIYMPVAMVDQLKVIAQKEGRSLCGQIVFILNNFLNGAGNGNGILQH